MEVIFDRYYRLVMSVALRIVRDVGEAEDVVQVVFLAFYERARLFDEEKGNLRTWLLQYAYGRSYNQKRKLRHRHFYDQVEITDAELELPKGNAKRLFDLDEPEALRLVEEILPKLNEKQRYVFERVFFQGMKLSEIALQLGESIGNVQHAYYRGIEKLRAYLAETERNSSANAVVLTRRFSWLRKNVPARLRVREEI
jgi:RNA polymerase sigma-70 factor (ECF subfamily)